MRAIALFAVTLWSASADPISLQVKQGRPLVAGVYVDGAGPFTFLLDTGAQSNAISETAAAKMQRRPAFTVELVSSQGVARRGAFVASKVTLGGFQADHQEFLISPAEEIARLTPGIDGVLGQAFLSRTDYGLDLRRKTLTLGAAAAQGVHVPFERSHGRMLLETSHGRLVLDSGADALVLDEMVLRGDGRGGVLSRLATATGSTQVRTASVDVMVGERRFYDVAAALVPGVKTDDADPDGLLPLRLLRSIYVSNSGEYVILNPRY